jgi:uncharacterized protein
MADNSTGIPRRAGRVRETPEQRRRKKIIQICTGTGIFVLICIIAYIAQQANPKGAFLIIIGTGFGYVLQRSRFCFTASLRDPALTGGTNLTKAVIVSLTLASLLFMAINMAKFGLNLDAIELKKAAGHIRPAGMHTALGAFLFGIGAVIAGGCASGTLMRMGEGFQQQWLTFVFFVFGSVVGLPAAKAITSETASPVFLPQALGGWMPAIIVQFGLLFALYLFADAWGRKHSGGH